MVYGVGNIGKFSFYEIKKNYWRQLDWKMRGVAATNHQMCNTFEGLRKKCLFQWQGGSLLGYRERSKMTPNQRRVLS